MQDQFINGIKVKYIYVTSDGEEFFDMEMANLWQAWCNLQNAIDRSPERDTFEELFEKYIESH